MQGSASETELTSFASTQVYLYTRIFSHKRFCRPTFSQNDTIAQCILFMNI